MARVTRQRAAELSNKIVSTTTQHLMDSVTVGTVVDTNDPQQMGRVRVVCTRWGDSFDFPVDSVPWALYASPFGGRTQVGTRGNGIQESKGSVAYGMWAIPKVGAQVVVMCVDSDPNQRVYLGCIYDQFTPHTLPHGRFMYDDHPLLDNTVTPSGPYTSAEQPIEPLNTNLKQAFGNKSHPNFEWQNRGADYTASALDVANLNTTQSSVPDDKDVIKDGWTSRQGYQTNRQDPNAPTTLTPRNLDSMVYSLTSPGFHSISMDDRIENCRMRFRTTSGHQIILDDTNERIYISTAKGENWIELDQSGNIDIFTNSKLNVRAKQGINFTSDEDIRFHAKKQIHLYAGDNIHVQAENQFHVKTGNTLHLTSGSRMNFLSSEKILQTGTEIHFNGPAADPAEKAKWTHRVPDHEPFARVMTKNDYTHEPELPYDHPDVNRVERGRQITRGLFWRR
jgi:hypothetical protein